MSASPSALADRRPPIWRRLLGVNAIGLLLLAGTGVWSLGRVLTLRGQGMGEGERVVRICHWQLEAGYREALQTVIDEYNAMHRAERVTVVQMPVTEKVYGAWLNTQLIAGTAPDLCEMGGHSRLSSTGDGLARYFMPLGQEVLEPNPYNAPAFLDELDSRDPGVISLLSQGPWRETLVDGMRGGWSHELQDYYSISTAFFTQRLFYNQRLYREATGSDTPPRTLGQLLAACAAFRALGERRGRELVPIAGTRYHRDMFVSAYLVPFSSGYQETLDTDLTGEITEIETYAGWQAGKVSFAHANLKAYYELVREITKQFHHNYMAMERDAAVRSFVQQDAAMMASGSWDANSLFLEAEFPIGIVDLPMPGPGERWSEHGRERGNEAITTGGASFGVSKRSANPEWALDFLRFLTSHKWNQKYNRLNVWLPITIGASPQERMRPFMPDPRGVNATLRFEPGYNVENVYRGQLFKLLTGESDYAAFSARVEEAMNDPLSGIDDIWLKKWEAGRDNAKGQEKIIAVLAFRQLNGDDGVADRLREMVLEQALQNNAETVKARYRAQNRRPFPEPR